MVQTKGFGWESQDRIQNDNHALRAFPNKAWPNGFCLFFTLVWFPPYLRITFFLAFCPRGKRGNEVNPMRNANPWQVRPQYRGSSNFHRLLNIFYYLVQFIIWIRLYNYILFIHIDLGLPIRPLPLPTCIWSTVFITSIQLTNECF